MKLLGIKAAGRPNGNSTIILNELVRPAKDKGYEIEILNLASLNLKHCTGCFGCNNSELKCVVKDDLEIVKEKINSADGIVLVSPCFALGSASTIKTVLDRATAWALNIIALNQQKKKYGVAVSVGGGLEGWYTLQRVFMSEFLGIFNCDIVGNFTFNNTALKGELILYPKKIELLHSMGNTLVESIENQECKKFTYTEDSNYLICPTCFNDVFQITKKSIWGSLTYSCPVCNTKINQFNKIDKILKKTNYKSIIHRFTKDEAGVHLNHIGSKIIQGVEISDEINSRLNNYFKNGCLPTTDFESTKTSCKNNDIAIVWNQDALESFNSMVPKIFQGFVKKAIEKKADTKGFSTITKDIFLKIKRESGN